MTMLQDMTADELREEYRVWRNRYDASRGPYADHKPGICMVRMARIEAHARHRRIDLSGDPHPAPTGTTLGTPEREEPQ